MLEQQSPADVPASLTEIPDPTQTPPPAVMLDGAVIENVGTGKILQLR